MFIFLIFPLILLAQDNYEFGQSIIVNDDPPGTHYQATTQRSIACCENTVYLVWRDDRYGNALWWNSRIFFSKSTDSGQTWSSNIMISQDEDTIWCFGPHVALDGLGNIYVGYTTQNQNDNNDEIYFVKSTNGGVTFSSPIMVNDSIEVHHQAGGAIAVDSAGQHVYVVWQDWRSSQYSIDIYFARSTDGGASLLPSMRVNDDSDSDYQWYPVVACDNSGQHVYVAWQDGRDSLHNWDIYFSRSTDYGQTFEANYPINDTITTGNTPQDYPSIYYKNDIIYAVWHDGRDPSGGYFAKSIDNGVSFGPNVLVTDDPWATGYYSSITADDSTNVYIVWRDYRNYDPYGHEIYFAFSDDSSQTFKPNVLVNDHEGSVSAWDMVPAISVNQTNKIFVAWHSDRNDPSHSNFDIYFASGNYVGIEEHAGGFMPDAKRLDVYPNPFRDKINLRWEMTDAQMQDARSKNQDISLKIYDVSGRLVKTFSRFTPDALRPRLITWDGADQADHQVSAGIYFVELVNDNKKYVKKVVKIGGVRLSHLKTKQVL
jgi:hypothetical protein